MRTEWLAAHVTTFGPPDIVERADLEIFLVFFLANSGRFCGRGATL